MARKSVFLLPILITIVSYSGDSIGNLIINKVCSKSTDLNAKFPRISGAKWMLETSWVNARYGTGGLDPDVVIWDGSQAAIKDREGCARYCLETKHKNWGPCIGFNYPGFNSGDPDRTSSGCAPEYADRIRGSKSETWQYYMLVDRNPACIDIGMQGYRCGFEKDDCRCSGSVAFGIPGTANIGNFNGTFTGGNEEIGNFTFGSFTNDDFKLTGTWSELKRDVNGSINCEIENFVGYETDCDQKPGNKPCESKKECRCFPDSLKCIIMEGRLKGKTKKIQLDPVTTTEECIDQVRKKEPTATGMYWTGLNETGGKECYATMDIVLVEDIDNDSDHYVCNFKVSTTDATKTSITTIATDKESKRPSTMISTLNEMSKETGKLATTKKIGKPIVTTAAEETGKAVRTQKLGILSTFFIGCLAVFF